jgi:hypothetical protein
MKELDFNMENSVKVLKAMERGLVAEYARDAVRAINTGGQPDSKLEGMTMASHMFVDILTKETDFREAIDFLSKQGVTIE